MTPLDKKEVLTLIRTSDLMVRRSLVVLYRQQTFEERQDGSTIERNEAGFNAWDAKHGTQLAEMIVNNHKLGHEQYTYARRILKKYANQLARLANAGAKADIEEDSNG